MVILDKLHHIEIHFNRWLNTLEGGEDSSLTVLPDTSVLHCKTGCDCFGVQHLQNEPSSSTESVSQTRRHPMDEAMQEHCLLCAAEQLVLIYLRAEIV